MNINVTILLKLPKCIETGLNKMIWKKNQPQKCYKCHYTFSITTLLSFWSIIVQTENWIQAEYPKTSLQSGAVSVLCVELRQRCRAVNPSWLQWQFPVFVVRRETRSVSSRFGRIFIELLETNGRVDCALNHQSGKKVKNMLKSMLSI